MNQSKLDKIARISLDSFNKLPKTGKPTNDEWTVFSCMTIEYEENENVHPVAIGTGSKCIGRSNMSKFGDILNDSHAEIVCRRSFLLYLYSEIEKFQQNQASIIQKVEENKFVMKPNIKFHFFSTLMPCGDASIFPKNTENVGNSIGGAAKRQSSTEHEENSKKFKTENDIYRTGAKCLNSCEVQDPKEDGENYHITGVVRTKPGRGDPTLSVSCSDKLAKWCHLGIQGALLSIVLKEPIFISSFIIASNAPFFEESLYRAVYGRFKDSTQAFHTIFHRATDAEFAYQKRDERNVCSSSIIWHKNNLFEVAVNGRRQGVTKKTVDDPKSRLAICKLELFKKFLNIRSEYGDFTYSKCKDLAVEYQEKWSVLRELFKSWPRKDAELLNFNKV